MAASREQLWEMSIRELVEHTLPKTEQAHGVDYAAMAQGILNARVAMEATEKAAAASKSAARATWLVAAFTLLLAAVEIIRLS